MQISVSQDQGRVPVTVFHLQGDWNSEEPMLSKANEAYESGARNILIDLSDVPYMSSAGLRSLHAVFNLLKTDAPEESDAAMRKGIAAGSFTSPHLKLLRPSKHVLEVLRTAGYDMFLDIRQDYKKAIESF